MAVLLQEALFDLGIDLVQPLLGAIGLLPVAEQRNQRALPLEARSATMKRTSAMTIKTIEPIATQREPCQRPPSALFAPLQIIR